MNTGNPRLGKFVTKKTAIEPYKVYIPPKLLFSASSINIEALYPPLECATQALASFNSILNTISNTALFIYLCVRKEALLSSQIEGTQSSFSDLILFEHHQKTSVVISKEYLKILEEGADPLYKILIIYQLFNILNRRRTLHTFTNIHYSLLCSFLFF